MSKQGIGEITNEVAFLAGTPLTCSEIVNFVNTLQTRKFMFFFHGY